MPRPIALLLLALACLSPAAAQPVPGNLLPDPSVEETQPKNQFGVPFKRWTAWIFEGPCELRNGKVARTGETSAELIGAANGKVRLTTPKVTVEPGRYRFACYLRGLDLGGHPWRLSLDFAFADYGQKDVKYTGVNKLGSFGWSRVEMVADVPQKADVVARVGLWGSGRLWVDDAELVRVPETTPLTPAPVFSPEEEPLAPPAALTAAAVRCPDCGYRNLPAWKHCYACGAELAAAAVRTDRPATRLIAGFEAGGLKPFSPASPDAAELSTEHATEGGHALKLNHSYVSWAGAQDWSGYDFVKADVYNANDDPAQLYFEVRDRGTTGYWTRVNYVTVLPPGASTLIVPTALYVGEKSRPGRALDTSAITVFALSLTGRPKAPVYFDNLRLERDESNRIQVPGLQAYAFAPEGSRPMSGFTPVYPGTLYSPGRGYGFRDARIWRAFDVLQPDPLYQTFICVEGGAFVADVPDGRYHVFMNLDNPSGFWGEYQVYRERVVKANGVEVVHDRVDFPTFVAKYYRFADTEDLPTENTFDKYQRAYFQEQEFDVDVVGGKLALEFQGQNWANSLSTIVLYPAAQAELGRKYLDNLRERRRFYFDNYFKRILPDGQRDAQGRIPDLAPTADEQRQGYVLFARDWMKPVPYNAVPRREEVTRTLDVQASAGELEPIVFSVHALRDLGQVTVTASDLVSGDARVPASAIQVGTVSHRLSRVTMEGTVYTIAPRLVMPRGQATLRQGMTTTFWFTLHTPNPVKAGTYAGRLTLRFADGHEDGLAIRARLFATPLDEVDLPAGPWGNSIDLPWRGPEKGDYDQTMFRRSLAKMREYGCTTLSGIPQIVIKGWQNGKPQIDFTGPDQQMAAAREAGFRMVVNYGGGIVGFNNYFIDDAAKQKAGFTNYVDFLKAVLTTIDEHARAANWLPVAYNLCDEPIGDAVPRATANAQAWREAAPAGILTTGATSVAGAQPDDPHLALARALKIADLNLHDEAAVKAIHDAGSDWAFYNGGNRWTFGTYLYKLAKEQDLKFRVSWHWNVCAGDPYYALDCREDDYAWCLTNARQELITSLDFERVREGLDDYRYLKTLDRLTRAHPDRPAAGAAKQLIADKLASFQLGERDHDAKWPTEEFRTFRRQLAEAIEQLAG